MDVFTDALIHTDANMDFLLSVTTGCCSSLSELLKASQQPTGPNEELNITPHPQQPVTQTPPRSSVSHDYNVHMSATDVFHQIQLTSISMNTTTVTSTKPLLI